MIMGGGLRDGHEKTMTHPVGVKFRMFWAVDRGWSPFTPSPMRFSKVTAKNSTNITYIILYILNIVPPFFLTKIKIMIKTSKTYPINLVTKFPIHFGDLIITFNV